ncbi:VOC family protein [Stutzerimonas urumqiensis]|uniref:VOC family protein n=1 Tax=Stutzerimonas urumqiensis TaxID=638269 RepID=UPI003BAA3A66
MAQREARLMQVLVNVDVSDLDQGIAFYCRALGLHLTRRLFQESVAELRGAGVRLYLIEQADGSGATPAGCLRDYREHWTPVHLDFVVDDLDAAVHRAIEAGAVAQPAQHAAWGSLVTLRDPFGHGVCLVSFNGAPYEVGAT